MNNESDIQVLAQSKTRSEIMKEASRDVPQYDFLKNIPVINKQNEIACIVKCILPKSLRHSLMSSTLNYNIRVTDSQHKQRKQE